MNFQNDERNGRVRVIHQINHTKMIVVIPKSTQRIDFTMTLIMMNGFTPTRARLKWLQLNPCPARSSSSAPWAWAGGKAASRSQASAWLHPRTPPSWVTSSFQSPEQTRGQQMSEVGQAHVWTRKQSVVSESEWRKGRTDVFHGDLLILHNYQCTGGQDSLPLSDELIEAQRGQFTQRLK